MAKGDDIIRNQLDSIGQEKEQIPFNKEASWERLHSRLKPGQKKRIFAPVRKWAAVALLLLTICTTLILQLNTTKTENNITTIKPTEKQPHTTKGHAEESLLKLKTQIIVVHSNTSLSNNIKTPVLIPEPTPLNIVSLDKNENIVSVKSPNKIKVIHINELIKQEHTEKEFEKGHYAFFNELIPISNQENLQDPEVGLPRELHNIQDF